MTGGERYVLLGLATAGPGWFGDVARWATSGAIAAEFLKASTAEEVAATLRSGRAVSAVLVGSSVIGWDRDLAGLAASRGCAVIRVSDRRADHLDGPEVEGASAKAPAGSAGRDRFLADATLSAPFDRDSLAQVLDEVAQPVARADDVPAVGVASQPHTSRGAGSPEAEGQWRARLVAVTGAGGTGRSTLAMALARGLAGDPRDQRRVLLADLALRAQQAVLHDSGDVLPGLPELIEAHRRGNLGVDDVRNLCFEVPDGGYDLLLGLRNPSEWAGFHAESVGAAVAGLRTAYRLVVADVDAEIEGEGPTGSVDVEERNLLARLSLAQADLVVVVGRAGLTGTHRQVELLSDLLGYGLDPARLLPVVNRAPKWPGRRSEVRAVLAARAGDRLAGARFAANAYCISERRGLDELLADGGVVPASLSDPLARTVRTLLDRDLPPASGQGGANRPFTDPARVEPGTVGRWTQELTGDTER